MNTKQNEHDGSENIEEEDIDIEESEAPEGETAEEKAERLETLNKQLFSRAKKAEGFELKDGKWVKKVITPAPKPEKKETKTESAPTSPTEKLTSLDVIALTRADIADEDIEGVVEYAQFKNISVAEALKSTIVQATLKEAQEARSTAEATSTGGGRRGNARVSDDMLLSNAQKGILPESDDDMGRLAELQLKNRKK